MSDKTVSIVNGILRVNGMARGRIGQRQSKWVLGISLSKYLELPDDFAQTWPTRKAAAEWVKERLANR